MVLGLTSETKIKVLSEKDCIQVVSVEIAPDKVKEKIEQALSKVQSMAKLPGFRPGKAPIELVRQNFMDRAYMQAQDDLLRDGVTEALKAKKINAVQSPVIQKMDFNPDKAFQFEFQVETSPKFKLSGHSGMKLNKKVKKVSDEDVKKSLTQIADMNAKLIESKSEILSATQFAVIDYKGFIEDKPIEGAEAQNFLLDMSAPQAIAGLSEGLNGAKIGEERSIEVKFPEDSPAKELAGKSATFKVKLNAIKEKQTPAIDDELAKDMGFDSLEPLKKRIRENIEAEADQSSKKDLELQIVDGLLKENEFPVPPSLVQEQFDHVKSRQQSRLARQGVSEPDQQNFLKASEAEMKNQAEREIRLAYIMSSIAEQEKIEVNDEEINKRIQELVERSEPNNRQAVESALKGNLKGRIQGEVRESKIFDWIASHGKVKEVSGGNE